MCDRNLEASTSCAGKDRKKYWTEHEVIHMLYLIEEKHILELLDGKRYRNSDIFHELAKAMAESGYSRTPEQLRSKWKSLKRDFYEAKRKNNKSGSERSDFAFYDEMASLLEKRPSTLLVEQGVDSAACEDASVEIEDDSQESESTGDDVRFTVSSDNSTTFSVSATSRPEKRRRTHTSRGAYAGALAAFAQDVRANHLEVLKEQQKWLSEEFERDRQWERELLENMQARHADETKQLVTTFLSGLQSICMRSAQPHFMSYPHSSQLFPQPTFHPPMSASPAQSYPSSHSPSPAPSYPSSQSPSPGPSFLSCHSPSPCPAPTPSPAPATSGQKKCI